VAGGFKINKLFVVYPGFNLTGRNFQADVVPGVLFKFFQDFGFIFRGINAID